VHARRIEIGDVAQDDVAVASGLQPGENVVTAGANLLFEGQKVRRAVAEGV
jgi:hypothetical protein